ncbi:MAG: hypothetical protein PHP41_02545 [Bacilli bacterium]|jgi:uncharacterized membrane protein HdeD (DUF308 family)|nr:hypothetical protein [Bacilli bacterium]MDY0063475.1 hypothetical protein [Bacilli bacterium]
MKNVFKKYLWLWEFIGTALILGIGLLVKFKPDVLIIIVGCIFVVMGLLRVIPLLKTTSDRLLKWIYLVEIILNIGIGVVLIYLGAQSNNLQALFGYLIGGVLYLRGIIYFFSTVLRKEDTDRASFIAHIIFFSVGMFIIGKGGFSSEQLSWVILGIAILSAVFVGYSGFKNYQNYRNEYAAKQITKTVKKEEGLTAPTAEEIQVPNKIDEKEPPQDEINA